MILIEGIDTDFDVPINPEVVAPEETYSQIAHWIKRTSLKPGLMLIGGMPGSHKSSIGQEIVNLFYQNHSFPDTTPTLIDIDEIRQQMINALNNNEGSNPPQMPIDRDVWTEFEHQVMSNLEQGHTVIATATFPMKGQQRDQWPNRFTQMKDQSNLPYQADNCLKVWLEVQNIDDAIRSGQERVGHVDSGKDHHSISHKWLEKYQNQIPTSENPDGWIILQSVYEKPRSYTHERQIKQALFSSPLDV